MSEATDAHPSGEVETFHFKEISIDPLVKQKAEEWLQPLALKKEEWAYLPIEEKIRLLDAILDRVGDWGIMEEYVRRTLEVRRVDPQSPEGSQHAGALMTLGPFLISKLSSHVRRCLESLKDTGKAPQFHPLDIAKEFGCDADALEGASVRPYDMGADWLTKVRSILLVEEGEGDPPQATHYRRVLSNAAKPAEEREALGAVCVLLAAGNQTFLGLFDIIHMAFGQCSVVLYKHHPLQTAVKEMADYILEPLISRGYLVSVEADIPLTQALVYSHYTDRVHLTGGVATHDTLVWGTDDPEGRKKANCPLMKAKMTSELGCVTPYIIVPGLHDTSEWTEKNIQLYAKACALSMYENTSCNCLACKVIILPSDPQYKEFSDAFVKSFKDTITSIPLEPAWYPGIQGRYQRWLDAIDVNGDAVLCKTVGTSVRKDIGDQPGSDFVLPFVIAELARVDNLADESIFQIEQFAPVAMIVRLSGSNVGEYVDTAFSFATTRLWGNLSASVFMPPSVNALVIPKIIKGDLLYGAVCINCPTFAGYQPAGYWGGPRGACTLQDVQSGMGSVCNLTGMYDSARNSIAWLPFGELSEIQGVPILVARVLSRVLTLGWKTILPSWLRKWIL